MKITKLKRVSPGEIGKTVIAPVDAESLRDASRIVERVRDEGSAAVCDYTERFGERTAGEPLVIRRDAMRAARARIAQEDEALLVRAADRIRAFAEAQRASIQDLDVAIPGGRAGHTIEPIANAGCYAPGGRYPLPSSVLMTAVTAKAAGCRRVVVACPVATDITLAAAAIAGADEMLVAGGAHAIAAMAYGIDELDRCDLICGPGNKWVTAAKQLVSGICGIDMLAGPSELLILADSTADPATVVADLLAQAEHDPDAVPMLVSTSSSLAESVELEIASQLETLGTRAVAEQALENGFLCIVESEQEMCRVADLIAPEHLEIITKNPGEIAKNLRNAGALFLGQQTAEVLGDYGAGPNHTLPTGGTSRFQAGLSVSHFLRLRTWIRIDDNESSKSLVEDAVRFGEIEGLEGHARSARKRLEVKSHVAQSIS